jgi:uncharacterized membrane protein
MDVRKLIPVVAAPTIQAMLNRVGALKLTPLAHWGWNDSIALSSTYLVTMGCAAFACLLRARNNRTKAILVALGVLVFVASLSAYTWASTHPPTRSNLWIYEIVGYSSFFLTYASFGFAIARVALYLSPESADISIRDAITAVPEVKWAVGVVGVISIAGLIFGGIRIHPIVAIFGFVFMILLMLGLVLFAAAVKDYRTKFARPASVLVWFTVLFIISTASSVFASAITNKPFRLRDKIDEMVGRTSTAIDFASGDTNLPPLHVGAGDYLRQFGITISDVTEGSEVVLQHDFATANGSSFSSPSHNVLTQIECHGRPVSFTLHFGKPLSRISLKRASLIAGVPNGVVHPAWTACPFRGDIKLPCKGERLRSELQSIPEDEFILDGPDIISVKFSSDLQRDGKPFAAFCGVLVESISLTP